jgi:hypothetical protein
LIAHEWCHAVAENPDPPCIGNPSLDPYLRRHHILFLLALHYE